MGRRLSVALLSLLLIPTIICARDWAETAARIEQSVVRLSHPDIIVNPRTGDKIKATGICSGFSIAEKDGYILTDYHCLHNGTADGLTVDGVPAQLLYANKTMDLAVVSADVHKPALRPSRVPLRKGDAVAALGHAYGFSDTLFRAGYVAHPRLDGKWLVFDTTYIGGMSGGPIFVMDGTVVGIVQQTDDNSGFGLTIQTVLNLTSVYWKG